MAINLPNLTSLTVRATPNSISRHFIVTCSNAGTEGDRLVKQFLQTLKGITSDWYMNSKSEFIGSWEQMEHEFLNRFYSTQRVVSMIELTSTRQWKGEPVLNYINRWRSLSLECKDHLSEASTIDVCAQGIYFMPYK